MLQKSFSESIFLERPTVLSSSSFKSTCYLNDERSYCTSVYFVPKLIPKRSYLTYNGASRDTDSVASKLSATYNRACSLSNGSIKSYESSVSMDQEESFEQTRSKEVLDGLDCQQNVELVPGLVMKEFSESVNIFSKTSNKSFASRFAYDEGFVKRNYVVGLEVQKVREVTLTGSEENSTFTSSMRITPEKLASEDLKLNGETDDLL